MAAQIELPKQVIVHSHWLSDGVKMSKSLGNVVDPIKLSEYVGIDSMRFFLMGNSNIGFDSKFSQDLIVESRDMLMKKYTNLIARVGGNKFDIMELIQYYQQGKFDNGIDDLIREINKEGDELEMLIEVTHKLIAGMNELYGIMDEQIQNEFDYNRAIKHWWAIIDDANKVFQEGEPWKFVKLIKKGEESADKLEKYKTLINYYVFLSTEATRICSILIHPVIPEISGKILDRLLVDNNRRNIEWCKFGKDLSYGKDANKPELHQHPLTKLE